MSEEKTYRIVELRAENIKRLKAVTIKPSGSLVQITGKNGNGKTSVLDAIWWAIEGASHIQAQPIRKGADKAIIRLDMGEIIITRKFKAKGDGHATEVVVETADGARFPTPQKILDSLYSTLTFDPLEFARMKPADQFDALRSFVPGFDFAKHKAEQDGDFARRTEHNRAAREAKAAAEIITVPDGTPEESVDESALLTQLQNAAATNSEIQQRADRRAATAKRISDSELQVSDLKKQIEALELLIASDRKKLETADPLPDPVDITALRTAVDQAKATNANVAKLLQKRALTAKAAQETKAADELTARMEAREKAKQDLIAAAKMPVEGLSLGDGVVLYNGLPFEQASDAEQLRASLAITMSANPRLRVIRVRDGSLLDDDAMKVVSEMAEKSGYQVWIERVDSSGKIGFVIEDGEVKSVNQGELL